MSSVPGSNFSMPLPYEFMSNYGIGGGDNFSSIDPSAQSPFVTMPATSGNWMDAFTKPNGFGGGGFGGSGSPLGGPAAAVQGAGAGNWWDGIVGTKEAPGWGGMALGAAGGLMQAFMGMKQYGLAKDTLKQNKEQFDKNYAAQKGLTNTSMEDRQRARVASNPGAYESVGDYMNKHGVQ